MPNESLPTRLERDGAVRCLVGFLGPRGSWFMACSSGSVARRADSVNLKETVAAKIRYSIFIHQLRLDVVAAMYQHGREEPKQQE